MGRFGQPLTFNFVNRRSTRRIPPLALLRLPPSYQLQAYLPIFVQDEGCPTNSVDSPADRYPDRAPKPSKHRFQTGL